MAVSSLRVEVFVVLALGVLSAGAILFIRGSPGKGASGEAFQGSRCRLWVDYLLLIAAILGSAMHAFIAPMVFHACANGPWQSAYDVFAFWAVGGPTVAMWCAALLAGRWLLRGGLTMDGRMVWGTFIAVGIVGWQLSFVGSIFSR